MSYKPFPTFARFYSKFDSLPSGFKIRSEIPGHNGPLETALEESPAKEAEQGRLGESEGESLQILSEPFTAPSLRRDSRHLRLGKGRAVPLWRDFADPKCQGRGASASARRRVLQGPEGLLSGNEV